VDSKLKADIIVRFATDNIGIDEYEDFFAYNDLGLPIAFALHHELCTITEKGVEVINETYLDLCSYVDIDDDYEYKSVDDFMSDIGDLDIDEE